MGAGTNHDVFSPSEDVNAFELDTELDNTDVSRGFSSDGDRVQELENAGEILTRVELDVACSCEKLVNLSILAWHVETKESEFEAVITDPAHNLSDSGQKALEFDLLSAILDCEVKELESFMHTHQMDIGNAREILSSCKYLGESLMWMEDKLDDSEKSLNQSLEQISEIKTQSAYLQRILLSFSGEENWGGKKGVELGLGNGDLSDLNEKIKMQTAEQQRQILRMLEKSLARELDLEKKVTESRQVEDDLKLRLHSLEQEVLYVEDEAEGALERLFESDNSSEVLMGVSKELLGQLSVIKFKLNGSVQREGEWSFKLQEAIEQLAAKDSALLKLESSKAELVDLSRFREAEGKLAIAESQTTELKNIVSLLEKKLKETELHQLNTKASADETGIMVKDLEDKVRKAEHRAESAEAKCKLLETTSQELNEELILLKGSGKTRVDSLEKQLRESEVKLQSVVASVEASLEKQTMLYSSIDDMENVIANLKSKVLKAESEKDSAEDKWVILSESNAKLQDELSFQKIRVENLESSLRKTEETKKATAKGISLRSKLITDLIMQMTLERERLQKQISMLKYENKILVKQSMQADKGIVTKMSHGGKGNSSVSHVSMAELNADTCIKDSREDVTESSSTSSVADQKQEQSRIGLAGPVSQHETPRNIDVWQLNSKIVSGVILMFLIPVIVAFLRQYLDSQTIT